jgi:hypothetical protein
MADGKGWFLVGGSIIGTGKARPPRGNLRERSQKTLSGRDRPPEERAPRNTASESASFTNRKLIPVREAGYHVLTFWCSMVKPAWSP